MTDRGLPIVDGAPACPFVAFEDDRDGRALAPDHRHRCFAEPRPAPRALAHQEAYCLSSAFPVCPTFQDWARREAAAARPAAAQGRAPADDVPVSRPMPPLERDARHGATETPPPIPPRRSSQRDWAAPPPWAGDESATPAAGSAAAMPYEDDWGGASRGLAGSAADRLAGPDPSDPVSPRPVSGYDDDLDDDLVPVDDDRYASPGAVAVGAAGVAAATSSRQAASPAEDPDDEPDWAADDAASASRSSGSGPSGRSSSRGRQPSAPSSTSNDQVRRREPQEPSELFGPAWERPRRYEAYPSLRTRVGLPGIGGIGRVGAAALALVLAALILFFVGPMLLGVGKDSGKPGAVTATATPATEATPSAAPTEPPAPTPKIYIVAKGDTINKIAKKNGVTVAQLLAANQQIKNPNKIKIGDQITIPVPVSGADDGTLDGGASASP